MKVSSAIPEKKGTDPRLPLLQLLFARKLRCAPPHVYFAAVHFSLVVRPLSLLSRCTVRLGLEEKREGERNFPSRGHGHSCVGGADRGGGKRTLRRRRRHVRTNERPALNPRDEKSETSEAAVNSLSLSLSLSLSVACVPHSRSECVAMALDWNRALSLLLLFHTFKSHVEGNIISFSLEATFLDPRHYENYAPGIWMGSDPSSHAYVWARGHFRHVLFTQYAPEEGTNLVAEDCISYIQ